MTLSLSFDIRVNSNPILAILLPSSSIHFLYNRNLAKNLFPSLPTLGLRSLRSIKTFGNSFLKEFPGPENFPRIQKLALSYAYHCCEFLQTTSNKPKKSGVEETIVWLEKDIDLNSWIKNNSIWTNNGPKIGSNFSVKLDEFANSRLWEKDYQGVPDSLAAYAEEYLEEYKSVYYDEGSEFPIQCHPEPTPFMPCEDLFGWWTLRCGVWMVFLLALLGNGVVVIVLIFGRSKIDVPRFLVCNLAMADLFMGVYLGLLAVMDASTLGEFRVYAVAWQTSWACQLSGFLGVFSSELSVYTLAVITLERNYAITHAMHLNKRLSLKHASYIMSVGWFFALIMALMPLLGVSDYRKFAVCLPFEIESYWSRTYVICLIVVNGIAFLILMGCYLRMYCAIKGSQAWNSNDSRIAKRMALLVFTDFLCWAPIAFFSLTAVSGFNLISLEEAKIFTIFILPLNSCCNPFLYAIFTKQFKKDCAMLCKRIEESRVTRGIGRGRNSSNFSNRQTPLNTNSAAEKRSGTASASDPGCPVVVVGVCQCGLPLQSKNGVFVNEYQPQQNTLSRNNNNYNISPRRSKRPESAVSTFMTEKKRLTRAASKWLWGSKDKTSDRQDSLQSNNSVKSSNMTSGSSLPRRSSLSSDNIPSSPSSSWKQPTRIPMRVMDAVLVKSNVKNSSWAPAKRDSSQASSSFKTDSTKTRSSFSSSLSGSKTTESSLMRSIGSHGPLTTSSSSNSNSLDDRPQNSCPGTTLIFPEGRGDKTSGSRDTEMSNLQGKHNSSDTTSPAICSSSSFLCHDCVLRREISSRRGSSNMNISRNQALEEKLNLYFAKLAEAAAAAEKDSGDGSCRDESCASFSFSDSHSTNKTTSESVGSGGEGSGDAATKYQQKETNNSEAHPVIEVEPNSPQDPNDVVDLDVNDTRDDVFLFPDREDSSRSPSTLSIRTQVPASRTPDLMEGDEYSSLLINVEETSPGAGRKFQEQEGPSSHSLLDVRYKSKEKNQPSCSSSSASFLCSNDTKLSLSSSSSLTGRKVSSDNSLRKSLTSLPSSILRSLSSQGSHFLSNNSKKSNLCKVSSPPKIRPSEDDAPSSPILVPTEEKEEVSEEEQQMITLLTSQTEEGNNSASMNEDRQND